jgi:hypothetical protein
MWLTFEEIHLWLSVELLEIDHSFLGVMTKFLALSFVSLHRSIV